MLPATQKTHNWPEPGHLCRRRPLDGVGGGQQGPPVVAAGETELGEIGMPRGDGGGERTGRARSKPGFCRIFFFIIVVKHRENLPF